MPEDLRAGAAFAAGLFAQETALRAGPQDEAALAAAVAGECAAARRSGAWTQRGGEALRLRALLLLWRLQGAVPFARALATDDRDWLLADDFFAAAPERLRALHPAARLLRLTLAEGTPRESAALRDLTAQEDAFAHRVAGGEELPVDLREWRQWGLQALSRYHIARRDLDRGALYAARLPRALARPLLALVALQREDHAAARTLARELLAAGDPAGHQLLAEALEAGGDPADLDEAQREYEQALALATEAHARAAAENGRGDCLLARGRLDEATAAYARALAACTDDADVGLLAERAETHKDLGRVHEARGEPGPAFAEFTTALRIGESARERLLADPFGGSWLRVHGDQLTAIDGVLRTLPGAAADPWAAVQAVELGLARSTLDAMAAPAPVLRAEELRPLLEQRLRADSPAAVAAVDSELATLRARAAAVPHATAVPGPEVLRALCVGAAGTTVLVWWLGRERAWLLAIDGARVALHELPPPAACRSAAGAAYASLSAATGDPVALAGATDTFLPPVVRAHLAPRVAVVLPAALTRLPVEALPVGDVPLGIAHAVVRLPSLAVAARLQGRTVPAGDVVVVDDAGRAEEQARLHLDPLRFSGREGAIVLAEHGGGRHLSGAAATFPALQAALRAAPARLLHVSAHAVDCPGLPSQSLLLLSDGPVASPDLATLALPGTVVVFSACGAGVGEQRGQEGTVGLVEGAFAAGAGTVVAPISEVNQQATSDLMAQFHHEYAAGADPASALQRARATLAAAKNYAAPRYWAPFAVFGGLHAASPSSAGAWWWGGGALVVATALVLGIGRRRRA